MTTGRARSHNANTGLPNDGSGNLIARFSLPWLIALAITWVAGCSHKPKESLTFSQSCGPCQTLLQDIEYPDLDAAPNTDGSELLAAAPITISNFHDVEPWELTVEQCVELALSNSKVLQKLGGVVVNSPGAATTLYDQALTETGLGSVESALSAFDAQLNTSFTYNRSERVFNNLFFGAGAASLLTNSSNFLFELSKPTATGATFTLRNITDYNRNNSPANLFGSAYDLVNQVEIRQPLAQGAGTLVNRIAGPNATPGNYNGVLIARLRSDISLADFERSVRDLVRDVETNYWELYFAYRDLDTIIEARDSARSVWDNRKLRQDNGVGRPDDEAIARQQYFNFKSQAQNALTGVLNGPLGVLGAERNMRRLMGLPTSDGRLIRPITKPTLAPVVFDWNQSQTQALQRRVELRRQKWTVRERELELIAAKALNRWRFDLVANYGFRGFGDDLFGGRDQVNGSAVEDLTSGDLDDWQVGFEFGGAIGRRQGHLAIRNAEINLVRERSLLKEQQRQILHDLNAAFTEVDRAMEVMKTSFNAKLAIEDELTPKQKRVDAGQDQIFFLLDTQQRAATAESAVHRAVATYNQALLNYSFTTGSLLGRYNIRLTEGPWNEDAQQNAIRKSPRFVPGGPANIYNDIAPLSSGAYPQSARAFGFTPAITAPPQSPSKEPSDTENGGDLEVDTDDRPDVDTGPDADLDANAQPRRR